MLRSQTAAVQRSQTVAGMGWGGGWGVVCGSRVAVTCSDALLFGKNYSEREKKSKSVEQEDLVVWENLSTSQSADINEIHSCLGMMKESFH